jgi:hypothetical protein
MRGLQSVYLETRSLRREGGFACDALKHVSSILNMAARRADDQVVSVTHAIQKTAILCTKPSPMCRAVTRPASEVTSSSNSQISCLGLLPPLVRRGLIDRPNDDRGMRCQRWIICKTTLDYLRSWGHTPCKAVHLLKWHTGRWERRSRHSGCHTGITIWRVRTHHGCVDIRRCSRHHCSNTLAPVTHIATDRPHSLGRGVIPPVTTTRARNQLRPSSNAILRYATHNWEHVA